MIAITPTIEEFISDKGNHLFSLFVMLGSTKVTVHEKSICNLSYKELEIYDIMRLFVKGMNYFARSQNALIAEDIFEVGRGDIKTVQVFQTSERSYVHRK